MMSGEETCSSKNRIAYTASAQVRDVIARMGRTEDLRFSPNQKQLAVACINENQIVVFDLEIQDLPSGKQIHLAHAAVLSSPDLKAPHGLDFLDPQTLLVANRAGGICQLKLPERGTDSDVTHAVATSLALDPSRTHTPGSLALSALNEEHCELLVCNNYRHTVGRLKFLRSEGLPSSRPEIFLEKWLNIPDGISASPSGQWVAVSNHSLHAGMLYQRLDAGPDADPQALLLGAHYPHGVRIVMDDRIILMADAGAPFVHLYCCPDRHWQGLHYPRYSLRTLEAITFRKGRYSPQEGGPKGIDLHLTSHILGTTCEAQPLAFFDLQSLLETCCATSIDHLGTPMGKDTEQDVRYELDYLRQQAKATEALPRLHAIQGSRVWRLTAPFRHMGSLLKRSLAAISGAASRPPH